MVPHSDYKLMSCVLAGYISHIEVYRGASCSTLSSPPHLPFRKYTYDKLLLLHHDALTAAS